MKVCKKTTIPLMRTERKQNKVFKIMCLSCGQIAHINQSYGKKALNEQLNVYNQTCGCPEKSDDAKNPYHEFVEVDF